MINFVCVKWGTLFGPEYVNILYDMVRRNIAGGVPGRFICFTDDPRGLTEGIETRPLPEGLTGWWNKLALFAPGLFPVGEQIFFLDLDTVITGSLDEIIKYQGKFAILHDFYRPNGWQSSFMSWRSGFGHHIWDKFNKQGRPNVPGGDQAFIEQVVDRADIWQSMYPDSFVSYKVHAKYKIPKRSAVVIFHGHPRPHEVVEGWVPNVWKIGGGSVLEMVQSANTDEDILIENIQHSCTLNLPWLEHHEEHHGHAVIVGGGPSLKTFADEIKKRADAGQTIIAVNGAWRWLQQYGIATDIHVLLDARKENVAFVPKNKNIAKFYASQCDREIFECAENVTLWHHITAQEIVRKKLVVAGGSTVSLNAIAIAFILGYRTMHLYGMDSCYDGDEHHAYVQNMNDDENVIEVLCGDRRFKTAAWMAEQVEQFRDLAPQLCALGCHITVHGDGLLQHCASLMNQELDEGQEIIEIEGDYWPVGDKESRRYVLGTLTDIDHIMQFVRGFDVAIQAGGHVGLWPREFAKRFNAVYTFEPDNVNFQCLSRNCTEKNVIKFQAALGRTSGFVSLDVDKRNAGAHSVGGNGIIPTLVIDDLGLKKCDLIQLDIEGFELKALKGARQTIETFSPVIVVEDKGLSEKYGVREGEIAEWLSEFGYRIASRIHRDLIFINY